MDCGPSPGSQHQRNRILHGTLQEQLRPVRFAELQSIDPIHAAPEGRKQLVSLPREDIPLRAGQEHRDAISFHILKHKQKTLEDLLYLAERCLFVIKRVEQPEDHRRVRMNVFEENGETAGDRLLHLITGEPPRDEDQVEKLFRVQVPFPREARQQMNIKLIAAIHHSDRLPLCHRGGCHPERQLENQVIAVQQVDLPRRCNK